MYKFDSKTQKPYQWMHGEGLIVYGLSFFVVRISKILLKIRCVSSYLD